eukprot:TRINITY_DN41596_c0_g1_i1.p1 TRINITY_DN41596_c0_g1~~TRINITY_DN41596_c0_g1_i1.p1  ORF type:complete len:410 (+),score=126.45 TRINITY_DN41596_c0_g1_i1:200-1429(+)
MALPERPALDGLPFSETRAQYIADKLAPVMEEMMAEAIAAMPDDELTYMINWLHKRGGSKGSQRMSVLAQNQQLKHNLQLVKDSLGEAAMTVEQTATVVGDEEDAEEDDELDEPPPGFLNQANSTKARASVSAEAYGEWNQKKAFEAPTYPKTPDQTSRLSATLQKSFMFNALEAKDLNTVLLAMKEVRLEAGQKIIEEGEQGDYLFIIESGHLDCIKVVDGQPKVLKTCSPGDAFGELALLYNCPRAATVQAQTSSLCWQLDRETFSYVVKDAAVKRRERYDAFLKSVTLLEHLGAYERSQVADALVPETFTKEECIVKQNHPGDKFYIVEEGTLSAMKDSDGVDKKVMDYRPGDYFGELALLHNTPRAASVVVTSPSARVLSMTRHSFNKMLGPLQELMKRQMDSYK